MWKKLAIESLQVYISLWTYRFGRKRQKDNQNIINYTRFPENNIITQKSFRFFFLLKVDKSINISGIHPSPFLIRRVIIVIYLGVWEPGTCCFHAHNWLIRMNAIIYQARSVRLARNGTNPGIFSDQIQYILARWALGPNLVTLAGCVVNKLSATTHGWQTGRVCRE